MKIRKQDKIFLYKQNHEQNKNLFFFSSYIFSVYKEGVL